METKRAELDAAYSALFTASVELDTANDATMPDAAVGARNALFHARNRVLAASEAVERTLSELDRYERQHGTPAA